MQYKIPQNIDMEDKIVGPFTMKQFIYLLVSGFIVYSWWNFSNTFISPPPIVIFVPLGVPVGILGISFALLKINDRPFEFFILSMIKFIFSPKQRVWREGYQPPDVIIKDTAVAEKTREVRDTKTLDELSKSLDTSQGQLDKKLPATPPRKTGAPVAIDLSVKNVEQASARQNEAQKQATTPKIKNDLSAPASKPAKKGFFGRFIG